MNVLLDGPDIAAPWVACALRPHMAKDAVVSVLAFAYRDRQVASLSDWYDAYGQTRGPYLRDVVRGFHAYGVAEDHVRVINPFTDTKVSASHALATSDVLYLPGGLPDRMMARILALDLYDDLLAYKGLVMGHSAGALIQLAEYHLSPDKDYPSFLYGRGLPYLSGFYLEVHYEGTETQNRSIRRVLTERNTIVYATAHRAGALLVDGGRVTCLGDVRVFTPQTVG